MLEKPKNDQIQYDNVNNNNIGHSHNLLCKVVSD